MMLIHATSDVNFYMTIHCKSVIAMLFSDAWFIRRHAIDNNNNTGAVTTTKR